MNWTFLSPWIVPCLVINNDFNGEIPSQKLWNLSDSERIVHNFPPLRVNSIMFTSFRYTRRKFNLIPNHIQALSHSSFCWEHGGNLWKEKYRGWKPSRILQGFFWWCTTCKILCKFMDGNICRSFYYFPAWIIKEDEKLTDAKSPVVLFCVPN